MLFVEGIRVVLPQFGTELSNFFPQLCAVWSAEEAVVQGLRVVVHGILPSFPRHTIPETFRNSCYEMTFYSRSHRCEVAGTKNIPGNQLRTHIQTGTFCLLVMMTPPFVYGNSCLLLFHTLSMTGKFPPYNWRSHFTLSMAVAKSYIRKFLVENGFLNRMDYAAQITAALLILLCTITKLCIQVMWHQLGAIGQKESFYEQRTTMPFYGKWAQYSSIFTDGVTGESGKTTGNPGS